MVAGSVAIAVAVVWLVMVSVVVLVVLHVLSSVLVVGVHFSLNVAFLQTTPQHMISGCI